MPHDLSALKDAVGASSPVATELVTAGPVARLAATFGMASPASKPGDVLPPGWADIFFGSLHRPDNMRPDGQAAKSSWMPPNPFSMIRIGDALKRVTKIEEATIAGTPAAPILRMVQRTETTGPRGVAIVEDREFVYFDKQGPAPEAAPALPQAVWRRTLNPDPVLLFRYSALRFNSHRIHYDRKYVMEEEGAPGLIVQSSLLGQLLLELCRPEAPDRSIATIRRVNRHVVFDTGPVTLCAAPSGDRKSATIWALDQKGAPAIHGEVTFR